ncbi:MAG: glycosyltransferase family 9 protein [Flavobacterium sp.]
MGIHWKVNEVRRKIMRRLTGGIGSSCTNKYKRKKKPELKKVLISRPNNRLGNLLLITPLVQEITSFCPDCTVDLFVRGNLAPIVFEGYPNVSRIIRLPKKPFKQLPKYLYTWFHLRGKKYDLVINVVKNSSSGRLSVFFASSRIKFFGDNTEETAGLPGHAHMAKYPVYNLRTFLKSIGYDIAETPVPLLDLKLTEEELAKGRRQLAGVIPDEEKKTICLFTNATAGKKFSEDWWDVFYARLAQRFPQHNIIEALPIENTSQIGFKAPSYYSADIRELGAFLAACDLFIGADSGVMHLASAVMTTTIGLFSVTDGLAYGPYGNGSACIDTRQGTVDDWMDVIDKALTRK